MLATATIVNATSKNVYDENSEKIEKLLLESAIVVEGVLKEPKPYVFVSNLLNFSVEYTLYVFISQIKKLPIIESNLKRKVLEIFAKNGIDLTIPNLVKSVSWKNNVVYSE